jgi:hypothetical protein
MSTSEPFLPVSGEDALPDDSALEPQDHDARDESEPDVLGDQAADADADVPPVSESTVFRTPTGDAVDPAGD